MQGKFATDCDGSVRHEKWQEPAGTLLMALTAYTFLSAVLQPQAVELELVRTQ